MKSANLSLRESKYHHLNFGSRLLRKKVEFLLSKPVWEDSIHEEEKRNLKCPAMQITDEDLVNLILENTFVQQQKKQLKELALTAWDEVADDDEEDEGKLSSEPSIHEKIQEKQV